MANKGYFTTDQAQDDIYGYLSPCENCAASNSDGARTETTCAEPNLSLVETLVGEDPDVGTYNWAQDDISQCSNPRPAGNDHLWQGGNSDCRWPYQIKSKVINMATECSQCSDDCAYLIRIKYRIKTSSRRRSYLQCGASDIFLVEKWTEHSGEVFHLVDLYHVASSVPFKWEQITNDTYDADGDTNFLKYDYENENFNTPEEAVIDCCRFHWNRASDNVNRYFNPYGLREDYDPAVNMSEALNKLETHCGTLSFFVKGNDKIILRLAQHTNIPPEFDMNPDCINNAVFRNPPDNPCGTDEGQMPCPRRDMLDSHASDGANKAIYDGTKGVFVIDAFSRPVPGDLNGITQKSSNSAIEKTIKYYEKLY